MNREAIQFDTFEIGIGDKLRLSNTMKTIEVLDLLRDDQQIYAVMKYGEGRPTLLEADRLAYYIVNHVYQPEIIPTYKIGQRFVHRYNDNTVEILAVSPAVGGNDGEYIYFCVLTSEEGVVTYINVDESYFNLMTQLEPKEDLLPLYEIPTDAVLPKVKLYIKPPTEFGDYIQPTAPQRMISINSWRDFFNNYAQPPAPPPRGEPPE